MNFKLSLEHWNSNCADGCCPDSGIELILNESTSLTMDAEETPYFVVAEKILNEINFFNKQFVILYENLFMRTKDEVEVIVGNYYEYDLNKVVQLLNSDKERIVIKHLFLDTEDDDYYSSYIIIDKLLFKINEDGHSHTELELLELLMQKLGFSVKQEKGMKELTYEHYDKYNKQMI